MTAFTIFVTMLFGAIAFADGLVIHGVEMGVAKFHRQDDQLHIYDVKSAWKPYILPQGASAQSALVRENTDGSRTIFFTSIEELLQNAVMIAKQAGQPIAILNVEAHGLPGGMWYPKDRATRDSGECEEWRATAYGDDVSNYDDYYSAVPKWVIDYYRDYSDAPTHIHQACISGLNEWTEVVARNPEFRARLADGAQLHFLSCIVGLGVTGQLFNDGVAKAIFTDRDGQVLSSLNYGLGDWSIPEGLGFWDYQNDAQLDHDNEIYPVDRQDREITQKGTMRSSGRASGAFQSTLVSDVEFLDITRALADPGHQVAQAANTPRAQSPASRTGPRWAKLPGTRQWVDLSL